jgi:hypothetical protein
LQQSKKQHFAKSLDFNLNIIFRVSSRSYAKKKGGKKEYPKSNYENNNNFSLYEEPKENQFKLELIFGEKQTLKPEMALSVNPGKQLAVNGDHGGKPQAQVTTLMKPDQRTMMCKQWWNFCFVYGDQTKYYRQLYGKRKPITTLQQQQQDVQEFCQGCGHIFIENE